MIRIRYTFQSVENGIRWNDFLSASDTPCEVLASFRKTGPKYMIANLVDMRLFRLITDQYKPEEVQIEGCEQMIAEFIISNKE